MPSLDQDPRFGRFGVRTECPRCGAHLPVNGPATSVTCGDCQTVVPVRSDMLMELLDGFEDDWPKVPEGRPAGGLWDDGHLAWRTTTLAGPPLCPSCRQPVDPDAIDPKLDGDVPCRHCAAPIPCYPVPDWLRKAAPAATQVIGGERQDRPHAEPVVEPVAMACPQCGAGLSVGQERARVTECDFCGSSVHLPDAVWRALHPARTVEEWAVRFRGKSRAARRAEAEAEKKRKRAEKERRKREARERREKEEAAREAERAEERARKAAERAEQRAREERVWKVKSLAWLGAATVTTLGAAGLMGLSTLWIWVAGRMLAPRAYAGRHAPMWVMALDPIVLGVAAAAALVALAVDVMALSSRSRRPLGFVAGQALPGLLGIVMPAIGMIFGLGWALKLALKPLQDKHRDVPTRGGQVPLVLWTLAAVPWIQSIWTRVLDMTLLEMFALFGDS